MVNTSFIYHTVNAILDMLEVREMYPEETVEYENADHAIAQVFLMAIRYYSVPVENEDDCLQDLLNLLADYGDLREDILDILEEYGGNIYA